MHIAFRLVDVDARFQYGLVFVDYSKDNLDVWCIVHFYVQLT